MAEDVVSPAGSLAMIRDELTWRAEPLHKLGWKTVVIPLVPGATGRAIGVGVDVGSDNLIQIDSIVQTGSGCKLVGESSSYLQELQAIASYTGHTAHGSKEGVVLHPEIVASKSSLPRRAC